MTTLTYVLASENGAYNPTVPWGHLHTALNVYSRYKAVTFVRINDWNAASLRIVNAKSLDAWATYSASRRTIRIHPTVDYGRNPTTLTKVIQHECGHFRNSSHHNNPLGLMHPTAGTVLNWAQIDDPWWNHRPWRGSLRPWNEPTYFRDVFVTTKLASIVQEDSPTIETEDAKITFGCKHTEKWWHKFIQSSKIVSVAELSRAELKHTNDLSRYLHD